MSKTLVEMFEDQDLEKQYQEKQKFVMSEPCKGTIELAETMKQYQDGLITFGELITVIWGYIGNEECVNQMLDLRNKCGYQEMIRFQNKIGL